MVVIDYASLSPALKEDLLMWACQAGHLELLRELYTADSDVFTANAEELSTAAASGHIHVVRWLLTQEPHIPAKTLRRALHYTDRAGNQAMGDLLRERLSSDLERRG